MNRTISSLQGLRAIGAIMIFIHHYCDVNPVIEALGDCALNWFMTISGFVLCAAYKGRTDGLGIRQFMAHRFKRVAPAYYISLAIMLIISVHATGIKAIGASLLMIQSWFPDIDIFFSLNSPAWFISDLMFCSLLFIPLSRLFTKHRKWLWLVIAIGGAAYFATVAVTPADMTLYWIYIFPPMQLASFVAGMLLWQVASRWRWAKPSPSQANILIISAFALVALLIAVAYLIPERFSLSSYWWPSTWLLLIVLTLTDRVDCVATKVLNMRPLRALGDASLYFYMLQLPWIILTQIWLWAFDITLPLFVELSASILLLALISCLIDGFIKSLQKRRT